MLATLGAQPEDGQLIIVDNGFWDGTVALLGQHAEPGERGAQLGAAVPGDDDHPAHPAPATPAAAGRGAVAPMSCATSCVRGRRRLQELRLGIGRVEPRRGG